MQGINNYFIVGAFVAILAALFERDARIRHPLVMLGVAIIWPVYLFYVTRDGLRELRYRYAVWSLRREIIRLGREIGGESGERIIYLAKKIVTARGRNA